MSLDVWLKQKGASVEKASSGIFIRENGEIKEITEQEWNGRYPNHEPFRLKTETTESEYVFEANITHNLGAMAEEAGIYDCLWHPDEFNIKIACDLIEPLKKGLQILKSEPERFKKLNPKNGWGNYEGLIRFIKNYIKACEEYPDAEIGVSR